MVIITSIPKRFGFAASTFWPFILIAPSSANNEPLIAHEMVHYREQRAVLTIPWLLRYWLSKRFRFEAEVRGHAVQVKLGGCSIEWAAWHIATKYKTGRSIAQTIAPLRRELSKL